MGKVTISIPLNITRSYKVSDPEIARKLLKRLDIYERESADEIAREISDEIKSDWWDKNKDRIEKLIGDHETNQH